MSHDMEAPPPVLVLGLGNALLGDDGAGLELLRHLELVHGGDPRVEFIDGGTQGIALLGLLAGRRAILLLDAAALGAPAGTVHRISDPQRRNAHRSRSAHEGNAGELLAAADLLGYLPDDVELIGIEPQSVCTGVGLSPAAREALERATQRACYVLSQMLAGCGVEPCTS